MHMTSTADAFRFFDENDDGELTFAQFNKLVNKVYEMGG